MNNKIWPTKISFSSESETKLFASDLVYNWLSSYNFPRCLQNNRASGHCFWKFGNTLFRFIEKSSLKPLGLPLKASRNPVRLSFFTSMLSNCLLRMYRLIIRLHVLTKPVKVFMRWLLALSSIVADVVHKGQKNLHYHARCRSRWKFFESNFFKG